MRLAPGLLKDPNTTGGAPDAVISKVLNPRAFNSASSRVAVADQFVELADNRGFMFGAIVLDLPGQLSAPCRTDERGKDKGGGKKPHGVPFGPD
ncbi:MAG: hypothetical protein V4601_12295, partial [Pseudomonadota bacterium]